MRIAVNRELIDDDAVLGHGDEVAFMPPVTGG
jgi:molybdopterin converting factor small subunit